MKYEERERKETGKMMEEIRKKVDIDRAERERRT